MEEEQSVVKKAVSQSHKWSLPVRPALNGKTTQAVGQNPMEAEQYSLSLSPTLIFSSCSLYFEGLFSFHIKTHKTLSKRQVV
jgi:hypothetical protein